MKTEIIDAYQESLRSRDKLITFYQTYLSGLAGYLHIYGIPPTDELAEEGGRLREAVKIADDKLRGIK